MEIYLLWLVRVGECLGGWGWWMVDGEMGLAIAGIFSKVLVCSGLTSQTYSPLIEDLHRLQVSCLSRDNLCLW